MGHVIFQYSSHLSKQPLWKKCPQPSRFTSESGSNRVRQTEHSWSVGPRKNDPNRVDGTRQWNSSAKGGNSNGSDGVSSISDGGGRSMPTTWRIDRTIFLKMEMERAVFTRRTERTPSEGAGRLESPISSYRSDVGNDKFGWKPETFQEFRSDSSRIQGNLREFPKFPRKWVP